MSLPASACAIEPPSASVILQELQAFRECGSVLYVAAHPDDENTQFIAYLSRGRGVRTGYLSLTRGEGGQNLIGPEIGDPLGVIRTQELLAARRVDGGEQFFSRARDFGFSKDYQQTLAKWDRREVLSDVVRVIRTFQPDVIVTRFSPEGGGTHGHHTASTVLAQEAFKLAGDPQQFPEQITRDGLTPWHSKRLFWNSFRGAGDGKPLRLDIGGYLPLLGQSLGEVSALSRSNHRSQGYGSIGTRGPRPDDFLPLDGQPAGADLFTGIDTTWNRFAGGDQLASLVKDALAKFKPEDPVATVPTLLEIHRRLALLPSTPLVRYKQTRLDRLIQNCLGLYVETTSSQAEVVPGESFHLRRTAILRSNVPVEWIGTEDSSVLPGDVAAITLHDNQPIVRENEVRLPVDTPVTEPYWLRAEGTPGMYRVDDPKFIGRAESLPTVALTHVFRVGGETIQVPDVAVQVTADPAKGEIRRAVDVVPPAWLSIDRQVAIFTPSSSHTVTLVANAARANLSGHVELTAPAGWQVSPPRQDFAFKQAGDHATFPFTVTAPPSADTALLNARLSFANAHEGEHPLIFSTQRQEIRYEHIPLQILQPPAVCKAVCVDLAISGKKIGYLPGAGDRTAESLEAMGYTVTPLTGADLTPERLRAFDAVVVGVRAFNVRADLAAGLSALFQYAQNGGNVVVQYNTPNDLRTPRLAPFDLELSRDLPHNRVTNENAPVTMLLPNHLALTTPNRITEADFAGWVQERGLNFPSQWDRSRFQALLACGDPGEAPLESGLLVADYGRGHFVYTGLSFFRQLPAGVPGAYRLFANLVSLPPVPASVAPTTN